MTVKIHPDREPARRRWDATAVTYDQLGGHGRVTAAEASVWSGLFARLLDPVRHRRVLDVGTGTGFLALLLADRGHQVTAIDFSEPMLAIAERKAREAGLPITFRLGDAHEPPLRGQVFDAVVSRHVLWTLAEPERAVRTWTEITAPGGQIVAVDVMPSGAVARDRAAVLPGRCLRAARTRKWPPAITGDPELPLRWATTVSTAANVFARAGLRHVRTELLESIDRVERAAMTLEERLEIRERHLVEGQLPRVGMRVSRPCAALSLGCDRCPVGAAAPGGRGGDGRVAPQPGR